MTAQRPVMWNAVPPRLTHVLFDEHQLRRLQARAETIDVADLQRWQDYPAVDRVQVILTAQGSGPVSEALMVAASELKAVVHAGTSVAGLIDPVAFRRGVLVSCQAGVDAGPAADYAFTTIVMALKGAFSMRERYRALRTPIDPQVWLRGAGIRGRRVGIVGGSASGLLVIERLRTLPVEVFVYEPAMTSAEARALSIHLVGDLRQMVAESDVISLHPSADAAKRHWFSTDVLAAMRDRTTLINTSAAELVDEPALIRELCSGRICAVLDVSSDDPPPQDSALWDLPNVFFTPNLAGAVGSEWRLLGREAADEVERVLTGAPLRHAVNDDHG